ncbi:unnamed protein product [Rangifer tarandus platyrhynchus]|uniref:Uncharacterized protein n=1 Tax=Rangifer tarandus platyrhynchus TaxID=3082113 RepID=A0AC59YL23_RANTA
MLSTLLTFIFGDAGRRSGTRESTGPAASGDGSGTGAPSLLGPGASAALGARESAAAAGKARGADAEHPDLKETGGDSERCPVPPRALLAARSAGSAEGFQGPHAFAQNRLPNRPGAQTPKAKLEVAAQNVIWERKPSTAQRDRIKLMGTQPVGRKGDNGIGVLFFGKGEEGIHFDQLLSWSNQSAETAQLDCKFQGQQDSRDLWALDLGLLKACAPGP